MKIAIVALLTGLYPLLGVSAPNAECLFLFENERVYQIPAPLLVDPAVEELEEGALVLEVKHPFGADLFISEQNALRIRGIDINRDVMNEFKVTRDGKVAFSDFHAAYRNTGKIPVRIAHQMLAEFARHLKAKDWLLAESAVGLALSWHISIHIRREDSESLPRRSWRPVALESLRSLVGIEKRDPFLSMRLVFDPKLKRVARETYRTSGEQLELLEVLTLSADGEVRRRYSSAPGFVIAHMNERIAQGIITYTYHYAAVGGANSESALSRFSQFLRHEVPELFIKELPRGRKRSSKNVGFPWHFDTTIRAYNPRLGLNQ